MTQRELAERIGILVLQLWQLESERMQPKEEEKDGTQQD